MTTLRVITPPTEEAVSLETAKEYLRVDSAYEDALIESLIKSARETGEELSRRAFIAQTLEMTLDEWPDDDVIELWRPPLQSVTSVKYRDEDGTQATWASTNYTVDTESEPGKIILHSTPSTELQERGGITVRYVAGYGNNEADVPERIKTAILAAAAYMFENRCIGVIPKEIQSMFTTERVVWF